MSVYQKYIYHPRFHGGRLRRGTKKKQMDADLLPHDTKNDAFIKQIEVLRKMGISGRAQMTFELSDNLRSTVESGIRQRHPNYNEEQVKLAVFRLVLDKTLFDEAFPGCEVLP